MPSRGGETDHWQRDQTDFEAPSRGSIPRCSTNPRKGWKKQTTFYGNNTGQRPPFILPANKQQTDPGDTRLGASVSEAKENSSQFWNCHDLEEWEGDVAEDGEDEGDVVGQLGEGDGGVHHAEDDEGGDFHHPQDELAAHVDGVLAVAALKIWTVPLFWIEIWKQKQDFT